MAKNDPAEIPTFFKPSDIQAAQDTGMKIRDNPSSILPPLAGWGQTPEPEDRDTIVSALMGLGKSMEASQSASRFGDPFAAALAAVSGAAAQPGAQAIANQRAQMQQEAQLRALQSAPVDVVSPALVQAHPELKGMPLAIVNQLAPLIEKATAFQDQHYTLDQAASLMSPDQTPASIAKTKAGLSKVYPNGFVPKDFAHVAATNNRFAESQGNKLNQADQKRLDEMGSDLDPSKQRNGAFGVSKQNFDTAERLQSMALAAKGNPNPRQMEELAIGINKLLSGANTGASEQIKSLIPRSMVGDMAMFKEWLTNNPAGTEQQAFVAQMMDTVAREKQTAADQIRRTQLQRAAAKYSDLEQKNPTAFYTKLQSYGIQPEDFQSWRTGGYKPISAVQGGEGQSLAGGEIKKRLSSGKVGVWDSSGKFLRYE